jgi:hypothetical protein
MIRRRDPGHFGAPFPRFQPLHSLIAVSDAPTVPVILGIVLFFGILSNFIIRGNHLFLTCSSPLILFLF